MLLALERSTACGSAAVFSESGGLLASVNEAAGRGDAFSLADTVLKKAGLTPDCVDRYAAGLGPGSFSGVRSAISLLNGMAASSGGKIWGVGSAVAAAYAYRSGRPGSITDRIVVVGDARRGKLWISIFGDGYGHCHDSSGFALIPYADIKEEIPADATVITSDWDRIGELLKRNIAGSRLYEGNFYPTAAAVGGLALSGNYAGTAVPIYLNPAVAVQNTPNRSN